MKTPALMRFACERVLFKNAFVAAGAYDLSIRARAVIRAMRFRDRGKDVVRERVFRAASPVSSILTRPPTNDLPEPSLAHLDDNRSILIDVQARRDVGDPFAVDPDAALLHEPTCLTPGCGEISRDERIHDRVRSAGKGSRFDPFRSLTPAEDPFELGDGTFRRLAPA